MANAPTVPTSVLQVPDDLVELEQWVLWRRENVSGRETKVPYSVRGHKASSTDPRTWAPFEVVLSALHRKPHVYAGLGFVFVKGSGLVGIDLDDCLDPEGDLKVWARGVVERFFDSYTEISPSGHGLKIWLRGTLPANLPGVQVGDGHIEMYDHARYFTVTGRLFRGAPLQVEDHSSDLQLLYERLAGGRKTWPLQPLQGGRIPHGQQHSTLVSIAGTLRSRRVCDEAIEACLQAINRVQCERPGPTEHISGIVRSSRAWAAK
jgi:primase-polymerase (primpol)-like protein